MGVGVTFGGKGDEDPDSDYDLCTNLGWAEFAAWGRKADPVAFIRVAELAWHGETYHVAELAEQLPKAAAKSPPPRSARGIVANLAKLAAKHKDACGCIVSDGG
jgi:hypothetical protein